MALADLLVRIGVDTSAFTSGLERFNSEIGKSSREAEKRFGNIARAGESLAGVGVALTGALSLPIAGFVAASTQAFAQIDSLKRGLFTLEKSAQGTERRFRELQEVAKLPGLGLEEAVRGDIRLRAIGLSSELSKRALLAFGNALASVGSGKADLDETIRQFGQLATASTLTAENLKPIIERVPQAAQILRNAFGTANAEQLRELGVTSQQVVRVLVDDLEELPKVTGGIKNALETFADDTKIALAEAGAAFAPFVEKALGGLSQLIGIVPQLAGAFRDLPGVMQTAAAAIAGVAFVGPVAIVAIGTVLSNLSAIATAFNVVKASAAFASALSALASGIAFVGSTAGATAIAMGALSATLAIGPWVALAGALGAAAFKIWEYRDAVNLAKGLEEQQAQAQATLVISLRQAGVDVDSLARKKREGAITAAEYALAIREATLALGDQSRNAAAAAAASAGVKSGAEQTKAAIAALSKQFADGQIDATAYLDQVGKLTGVATSSQASAAKLKLEIGELSQQFEKGKINSQELGVKLAALRDSHVKAASAVEQHNTAYTGFKRATFESQVLIAQQNTLLSEQRRRIEEVAAARLALSRGVTVDFGEIPDIDAKIKVSQVEVPPFTELEELNRRIEAAANNDKLSQAEAQDRAKKTASEIKRMGEAYKTAGSVGSRAMREVSTVLTNLSQGIGQAIFSGESFGRVFERIGRQVGASITSFIIQELLRASGILDNFNRTLSGVIRNITGSVVQQASGAVIPRLPDILPGDISNKIPSLPGPGGAGSAAGGAASAASSGLLGAVGAIGAAVSAVSGVVSNFQLAKQESSLNAIALHTLQTANDLANLRRDEFTRKDELFSKLDSLFQFTWVKVDELITSVRNIGSIPLAATAGAPASVNNFQLSAFVAPGGEAQFFDWFAAELRRRRLIP